VASREAQAQLDGFPERLVLSAEQVAKLLRSAVLAALFSAGATVQRDLELLATVREQLWAQTEPAFFGALEREAKRGPASSERTAERGWQKLLRTAALALFDEAAPMEPDAAPLVRVGKSVPRLVRARRNLLPDVALAAAVLAHVRADVSGSVARAVGPETPDKPETARLKPLRFRRLMRPPDRMSA